MPKLVVPKALSTFDEEPQIMGALGAAIIARERHSGNAEAKVGTVAEI